MIHRGYRAHSRFGSSGHLDQQLLRALGRNLAMARKCPQLTYMQKKQKESLQDPGPLLNSVFIPYVLEPPTEGL